MLSFSDSSPHPKQGKIQHTVEPLLRRVGSSKGNCRCSISRAPSRGSAGTRLPAWVEGAVARLAVQTAAKAAEENEPKRTQQG